MDAGVPSRRARRRRAAVKPLTPLLCPLLSPCSVASNAPNHAPFGALYRIRPLASSPAAAKLDAGVRTGPPHLSFWSQSTRDTESFVSVVEARDLDHESALPVQRRRTGGYRRLAAGKPDVAGVISH